MNRTSQWNFERDEILEAQLGKKMETSRAWHLRGKSQTKQNKERKYDKNNRIFSLLASAKNLDRLAIPDRFFMLT